MAWELLWRAIKARGEGGGRAWGALFLLLAAMGTSLAGRLRGCVDGPEVTPRGERGAVRQMELPLLNGAMWTMSEHRGEVVLVNLWATWCEPCREEIPDLERLAEGPGGPVVVGVSLDQGTDREQRVREFGRRLGVTYPLALSGANLALTGGVEAVPTTMAFDREGRLAKVYVGAPARRVMERDVRALQAER